MGVRAVRLGMWGLELTIIRFWGLGFGVYINPTS